MGKRRVEKGRTMEAVRERLEDAGCAAGFEDGGRACGSQTWAASGKARKRLGP